MHGGYVIEDVVAWLESQGCRKEEAIPHGMAFSIKGLAFSIPVFGPDLVDPDLLHDILTNRWLDFGPCPCKVYYG